jgi:hypothetical protein
MSPETLLVFGSCAVEAVPSTQRIAFFEKLLDQAWGTIRARYDDGGDAMHPKVCTVSCSRAHNRRRVVSEAVIW